jgi:hypothetical protein
MADGMMQLASHHGAEHMVPFLDPFWYVYPSLVKVTSSYLCIVHLFSRAQE